MSALSSKAISERINQYRRAEVDMTVFNAVGKPVTNQQINIRQIRHKFLFGANIFLLEPDSKDSRQKEYQTRFSNLLNFATLPFYWGSYEPEPGKQKEKKLKSMAEWCKQHDIITKGHPLCWHTNAPKWHDKYSLDEMYSLQMMRIAREVASFSGLIDIWDVLNEAIVAPDYNIQKNHITPLMKQHGRLPVIKAMFDTASVSNSRTILLLNDFVSDAKYVKLLEQCFDAGVKIDAIGIQSHMHEGYLGAEQTWEICERFAVFNKPLHFTEVSLVSGPVPGGKVDFHGGKHKGWISTSEGEQEQAEQAAEFYSVLFSHPAVEAITWWDLHDGSWLGAPSGLVSKDMQPKPAYERLHKLIKQDWWTEQQLVTDLNGHISFHGFLGHYEIKAGNKTGQCSLAQAGKRELAIIVS